MFIGYKQFWVYYWHFRVSGSSKEVSLLVVAFMQFAHTLTTLVSQ